MYYIVYFIDEYFAKFNNFVEVNYKTINSDDLQYFTSVIGEKNCLNNNEILYQYSKDYTEDLSYLPSVVLIPESKEQISELMKHCYQECIPVSVRGAGTGLSGSCLPTHGGVVLSMEKLNKILSIDTENFQAQVQPGVINEQLQMAVQELGLFYPPDPASKGSCTLGGNVAHSSGGPRCVKYGTTRDFILNLEVVLPNGDIIETGANVLKNSTAYNLTQLFVGSEGTLGIVTKITLKLIPFPKFRALLLCSFYSPEKACQTVPKILQSGVIPSCLEFIDRKGFDLSITHNQIPFSLLDNEKAFLLIEVDAFSHDDLFPQMEKINEVLSENEVINVLPADDSNNMEKFWKIRRSIGEVVKKQSIYKEEDTVVPRIHLTDIYNKVNELSIKYGFEAVCYGHAGDGNLHINILKNNLSEEQWNNELPIAIRELFTECKKYGGTISGEHGIGLVQKPYLDIVFNHSHFQLFKGIKYTFDPKNILNPGKIFDI